MKSIRVLFALLLSFFIFTGIKAQQQCEVKLTDQTPSTGQYTANVYVIYDGTVESYQLNVNVSLTTPTLISFDLLHDVEDNIYRVIIYIQEPGTPLPPLAGPFYSVLFNTYYWNYNNIEIIANLP